MSKVVTANMLATGHVVFLDGEGKWVHAVGQARDFADAGAAEIGLAQAQRDQERALIVDPFVTDRGPDNAGRPPMTLRDTIRAYGPTIRFDASGTDHAA